MVGSFAVEGRRKINWRHEAWKFRNRVRWSYLHGLLSVWLAWMTAKATGLPFVVVEWRVRILRNDGAVEDCGVVCRKLVTTAGLTKITDALHSGFDLSTFNFAGIGTGTNAPSAGDTALQTELTTQLTVANTRATCTSTKPSATSVKKEFVQTVSSSVSVSEFGWFSQAATGGGTLLDRATMTAKALDIGEGISSSLTLTFS